MALPASKSPARRVERVPRPVRPLRPTLVLFGPFVLVDKIWERAFGSIRETPRVESRSALALLAAIGSISEAIITAASNASAARQ